MANIYEVKKKTPTEKELLKAVNVGIYGNDVTCEVNVYTGLPSLSANPTDGKLMETITQTFQYGGYYTIKLNNSVNLDDSQFFSIVIKLTNPQKNAGILNEYDPVSTYDFSYYNDANKGWITSKTKKSNTVARIKVYTVNEKRDSVIANDFNLANIEIDTSKLKVDYNESPQYLEFPVIYNGQTLQKGIDYSITYQNNIYSGQATAIYSGQGNYHGTKKNQLDYFKTRKSTKYSRDTKAK